MVQSISLAYRLTSVGRLAAVQMDTVGDAYVVAGLLQADESSEGSPMEHEAFEEGRVCRNMLQVSIAPCCTCEVPS
jgi:hypothetical protein